MNTKKSILGLSAILLASLMNAQIDSLKMDLDLKTRAELDNGYESLIPKGINMNTMVLSRARLGLNYYYDKLEVRFAIQDAGVWGDNTSINKNGNVDFFEAWGKYNLTNQLYVKLGRQVLSYDNERLIGETDWAMQGRSFDAIKLSYKLENDAQIEVVATYNNDNKQTVDSNGNTVYSIMDGGEKTKSIQLIHFQTSKKKNFQFSAIAMNNLVQNPEGSTNALTTLGFNAKQNINTRFNISTYAYYQLGTNTKNQKKSAYNANIDFNYQPTDNWKATIGGEILSGSKYNEDQDKNTAFSPLYGTNHKFNGYMDYFTFNGAGMNDFYFANTFNIPKAGNIYLAVHYLEANQKFAQDTNRYLGTEIDLVYTYPVSKSFALNAAYSQMFASDQMNILKNVAQPKAYQSFMWIGFSFKPKFKLYEKH